MKIIAHRGSNRKAYENSSKAYDLAVEEGADRIECDVQLTKDNRAVVFHNDVVVSGNVQIKLNQLDFVEAKNLIKQSLNYDVMDIEYVIEKYLPQVELNIEIKPNSEKIADVVAKALEKNPFRDKVILSSFQEAPLVHLRDTVPDIKRACLIDLSTLRQWPAAFSNFAPQVFMQKVGTRIVHPYYKMVDAAFMEQAELKRWQVYTWAKMSDEQAGLKEQEWDLLYEAGVHGHCTNEPKEFGDWIRQKKDRDKTLLEMVKNIQQKTQRVGLHL